MFQELTFEKDERQRKVRNLIFIEKKSVRLEKMCFHAFYNFLPSYLLFRVAACMYWRVKERNVKIRKDVQIIFLSFATSCLFLFRSRNYYKNSFWPWWCCNKILFFYKYCRCISKSFQATCINDQFVIQTVSWKTEMSKNSKILFTVWQKKQYIDLKICSWTQ